MDWMLFWTAFGAIGATLGSIATTAAVIVALWQTKYANKKKLKVEFSDSIQLLSYNGSPLDFAKYVGITVTNIGNRNVKLNSWRIMLPNGHGAIIVQDDSPIGKRLSPPWPMTLEPEEQTSQHWEKRLFYRYINDEATKCNDRQLRKKIAWIVIDSTGKKYKIKTDKTVKDYYLEAKNNLDGK